MDAQGHRKIELQSADDLSYLISNVRRAAAESIDAAFPPVDHPPTTTNSDGDELRLQIERLVDEYIVRTFTLAAPNLTINGLPLSDPTPFLSGASPGRAEPEERHEPFDGRKRLRVEDLAREEEDLLREIAALKRRVPAAAAAAWAGKIRSGVAEDEARLEKRKEEVEAMAVEGALSEEPSGPGRRGIPEGENAEKRKKRLLGDIKPLDRQGDVERAFGGAVETLGRLKKDMPATVAKMERARVAGEYAVTER